MRLTQILTGLTRSQAEAGGAEPPEIVLENIRAEEFRMSFATIAEELFGDAATIDSQITVNTAVAATEVPTKRIRKIKGQPDRFELLDLMTTAVTEIDANPRSAAPMINFRKSA